MSKNISGAIERINKKLTIPIARMLLNVSWITPNGITWMSAFVGGVLGAWAIIAELNLLAAGLILIGGLLDSLDGDLARVRKCGTKEGEILDAVLDRYIDFFIIAALIYQTQSGLLVGLAGLLGNQMGSLCLLVGLAALLGNQMVPYVRARTEAAGKDSISTFGSRDIRNMILIVGLVAGWHCVLLFVLAVISNASAIHRFYNATRKVT